MGVLDLTRTDLATKEDRAYGIDTWAKVFLAKTWEELRMAVESNDYMKDAAQTLYELNSDELIRQQCEARRRAEIEEKRMNDKLEQLAELMEEKEKWENEKATLIDEKASLMADNANRISKVEELQKQLGQNQ